MTWRQLPDYPGFRLPSSDPARFYIDDGVVAFDGVDTLWLIPWHEEAAIFPGQGWGYRAFNIRTETWTATPPLQVDAGIIALFTGFCRNQTLHLVGCDTNFPLVMQIYSYNSTDGSSTLVASELADTLFGSGVQQVFSSSFDSSYPVVLLDDGYYYFIITFEDAATRNHYLYVVGYNFSSNTWRSFPVITSRVEDVCLAGDGTYLYLGGGFVYPQAGSNETNRTHQEIRRIHPSTGTVEHSWSALPYEFEGASCIIRNGKLEIYSGWYHDISDNTAPAYQPWAWSVDLSTGAAVQLADFPETNYGGIAAAANGSAYAGGGFSFSLNTDMHIWTDAPPPSTPNLTGGLDSTTAYFWRPRSGQ